MDETTSAETLTERVARGMFARHIAKNPDPWDTWASAHPDDRARFLRDATAALAVVADDVDGIAGVLRAHLFESAARIQGDWCTCGAATDSMADHQAAMVADYLRGA